MNATGCVCECSDPQCSFRFPAAPDDERRRHCPRCGAATRCKLTPRRPEPEADTGVQPLPGPPLELLLDNIRSAYNVGSLLRTADGAGLSHLYLCGITPTPENRRVAKTALGAEESTPWSYHRNAVRLAEGLQSEERRLWALETGAQARPLFGLPPLDAPLVLIVGNEMYGVDPALLALCDRIVCLPMAGRKRTLNVASAAAVAIYHLRYGHGDFTPGSPGPDGG